MSDYENSFLLGAWRICPTISCSGFSFSSPTKLRGERPKYWDAGGRDPAQAGQEPQKEAEEGCGFWFGNNKELKATDLFSCKVSLEYLNCVLRDRETHTPQEKCACCHQIAPSSFTVFL